MTNLLFDIPFILTDRLLQEAPIERCKLAECHGACCLHGTWIDPKEETDIREHASLFQPFLKEDRRDPELWFASNQEREAIMPSAYVVHSAIFPNPEHYGGTECVFLGSDSRCALQAGGAAAGEHPWRWKPFYCIIHPLSFDDQNRVTLAPDEELLAEPGSCFRPSDKLNRIADMLSGEIEFLRNAIKPKA